MTRYFIFVLIVSGYFFTIHIAGDKLDLYGAVVYYLNWIENIASLDGVSILGLVQSYNFSNSDLAAPEPVPGAFIYLITRIVTNPYTVLDILNVMVLYLMVDIIFSSIRNRLLLAVLVLALLTGYYEYVLLHMTHRFKISFLFFLSSVYFLKKKPRLSSLFYILSIFSHLSMLTIIPILFLLKRLGFRDLPSLSIRYTFFLLGIVVLFYKFNFAHFNQYYINRIWGGKFSFLNLESELLFDAIPYIPFILISIGLLYKFYSKIEIHIERLLTHSDLFWALLLLLYCVFTLSLIGTSRLLMLYYLCFLIMIVSNFNFFNIRRRQAVVICFAPLFFYSLFNGFLKGPMAILYDLA